MNCDIISLQEISNIMENFSLIFYGVGFVSHFFSAEVHIMQWCHYQVFVHFLPGWIVHLFYFKHHLAKVNLTERIKGIRIRIWKLFSYNL